MNYACSNGHLHILKFFFDEIRILPQDKDLFAYHNSLLMKIACERGHYDIFDYLHNLSLHKHACYTLDQSSYHSNNRLNYFYKKPSFFSFLLLALKRADMPLYDHLENKMDLLHSRILDSNGDTLLHAACISCDIKMVERVWSIEYNIDKKNEQGNTCLHLACEWGSLDVVKFLIGKKFNINEKNLKKQTPLHLCIIYERVDIFEYIWKECNDFIDFLAATEDNETLLHLAASSKLNIVKILVAHLSCDKLIITCDKYGETPIFNACRTGNTDMVSVLLNSESDLLVTNLVCETIFHVACRLKMKDILDIIFDAIDDFPPRTKNCMNQTLLHIACREGFDMVKYLASQKKYNMSEDINLIDKSDGLTPLQHACMRNNKKLFQYLLENLYNCDPDATNHIRETAFHICCKYGMKSMEKLCIDRCSMNLHDNNGDTPLHVASKNGNYDMLLSILKSRNKTWRFVSINKQGDTLLHVVAGFDDSGAHEVMKYLIENNICDYKTKNYTDDTVLHIACRKNVFANVKYLFTLEHDWCNSTDRGPLNCIVDCESYSFIKSLCFDIPKYIPCVSKVIKVNEADCHGAFAIANFTGVCMPLTHYLLFIIGSREGQHYCRSNDNIVFCKDLCTILKEFLRLDSSMISVSDSHGNNLMHYIALCFGCKHVEELCDEVIQLKCDVIGSVNNNLFSPLHFACLAGNQSVIFKILQQEGSSKLLHGKNNRQETPSDIYINHADKVCVAYLMTHGADMDIPSQMLSSDISRYSKNPSISIIVLGDTSVGKTTLVRSLSTMLLGHELESDSRSEPTTGMVTTNVINSKTNDHFIFRDFAGHAEFEMSHQRWLESLLSSSAETLVPSPVVFLFLVKATDTLLRSAKQIDRWFSFVRQHVKITDRNVHTALVCTHDDLIDDPQRKKKKEELKNHFDAKDGQRFYNIHDASFFLNGRSSHAYLLNRLLQYLEGNLVYSAGKSLSRSGMVLNAYLEKALQPCQVKCLSKEIKQKKFYLEKFRIGIDVQQENILFLPHEPNKLLQLLMQLHAQNYITILQAGDDKLDWWIINERVSNRLSSELNSIFSPKEFKDAPDLHTAHNTGVVPTQKLSEIFDHLPLDIELIESYLVSMEYCQHVEDKDLLKLITADDAITDGGNRHFFFPGLIKMEKELPLSSLPSPMYCGWLFKSPEDLGLRFLHLLLLRMTFKFASDDVDSGSKFERRLILWKSGIFWHSIEGIDVLVEVKDDCKVIALFRYELNRQLKLANIRFRVISEVQSVLKRCNVKESAQYVLYPPLTDFNEYNIYDTNVVKVSKLVQKLTEEPGSRRVYYTDTSTASLCDMLGFDSFGCLKESTLGDLKSSDSPLTAETFKEVEFQIGHSKLAQIIGTTQQKQMGYYNPYFGVKSAATQITDGMG